MRSPLIATLMASALLTAACRDTTARGPAAIYVAVDVRADEPLTFGYGVAIDGVSFRTVPFGMTRFTIPGLAPGVHVLSTTDLPGICSGGGPRSVTLGGGDTVTVVLNLTCSRASADLSVTVTTRGPSFDPDGYDVFLDGNRAAHVRDGTTLLRFQPVGTYTASLRGVAGNCTGSAPNPVQLTVGTTTAVSFTVDCSATGAVSGVSTFTGANPDADGVLALVDGTIPVWAPAAGGPTVRVPVGQHNFTFTDIAPNCSATSPLSGTLTAGSSPVVLRFSGTCAPIGAGKIGAVTSDPTGDTFAPEGNAAFDLTGVTTRQATGWMILVLHFAPREPGGPPLSALYGNIDLDLDENPATGVAPLVNLFGVNAKQGVEVSVILEGNDKTAGITRAGYPRDYQEKVPLITAGDSVVVMLSLGKLRDDGNATATVLVGTRQQPSDVAPNTGVIVVHRVTP